MNRSRMLAALGLSFAASCALAQAWPAKPIRNIMTLGTGGTAEAGVRIVADKLSAALGQPILVESHAGAGGSVGALLVARAAPDGYTILFASVGTMVMRPFLVKNVPYDPVRDFTPISQLAEAMAVMVAGPSIPGATMKDVVEYARANPGKVTYGSSGIGTSHHLSGEVIQKLTGVKLVHVPYKGAAAGVTDTLAGRISLMFGTYGSVQPLLAPDKLRLLAVNHARRLKHLPDVPTVAESLPGYERPPGWNGYFGPAGLPDPILRRLNQEIVKAVDADATDRLAAIGMQADTSTPEEFAAFIKANLRQAAEMMAGAGIQPR